MKVDIDVVAREEGGKKVFLKGEYAALLAMPVVSDVMEDLLAAGGPVFDSDLLSLVGGKFSTEGDRSSVEFHVPAVSFTDPSLGGPAGDGEGTRLVRLEASHAKWRTSAAKRLYRVSVTSV